MGDHAQQSLLGMDAINQRLVFLTQHQQLVFQLQFLLGSAAIEFSGPEAQAKTADNTILLPAGNPSLQLLKDVAAGKHLLR